MKAVFGGAVAVVLLGIYVHLLRTAYLIVDCVAQVGCTTAKAADFNDVMTQALSIISGLVSALVIAELAVTKPGDAPVARVLADDASTFAQRTLKIVTVVYVLVWLIAGLVAFMKGMYHPTVLPAFTNVGQAWLGLAVAAAYAYFGLDQKT
jgi:ABC-type thiamin/hydroxymethylpyrimidine transport system permease subunit